MALNFFKQQKVLIIVNLLVGNLLIELLSYINSTVWEILIYQIEFSILIIPVLFLAALSIKPIKNKIWMFVVIELESLVFFYLMSFLIILTSSIIESDFNRSGILGVLPFLVLPALIFSPIWSAIGIMNAYLLKRT